MRCPRSSKASEISICLNTELLVEVECVNLGSHVAEGGSRREKRSVRRVFDV